jgi:hypothetical protein
MNSGWFSALRAVLELLYFVSGVALTGVALYGLKQIALTKRIANQNARRESIKFAADRCQYYAENSVNLRATLIKAYQAHKLNCLAHQKFRVEKGEIVDHNFDDPRMAVSTREASVVGAEAVAYINSLEAFAIPFVAGVADDEVGFQETAAAFCKAVREFMIFIFLLRSQGSRFASCIRLYESWNMRLEAEKMKPLVEGWNEKIRAAEKAKFPPVEGS